MAAKGKKSLISQTLIYGSGRVLARVLSVLLLPLFTDYLFPSQYGLWQLLVLYSSVVMAISQLGLNNSLFRFYILIDKKRRGEVLFQIMTATIAWSILLVIAANLLKKHISTLLFGVNDHGMLVVLATIVGIFDGLFIILSLLYRIEEKTIKYTISTIVQTAGTLILASIFLIFMNLGVNGIFYAFAIGNFIVIIPLLRNAFQRMKFKFDPHLFWELLRYGIPFVPVMIATLIFSLIDRLIIRIMLNIHDVGIYSTGYRIASFTLLILTAFRFAWSPRMYRLYRDKMLKPYLPGLYQKLGAMLAAASCFVIFFGREIFSLLVSGEAYNAGIWIAPIVSIAYYFDGISLLAETGIYTEKRTAVLPIITLLGAFFNMVMNFYLIPIFGIEGAAIATVLSYVLLTTVYLRAGQKLLWVKIPYKTLIIQVFIIALSLALSWTTPSILLRILGFILISIALVFSMGGFGEIKKLQYIFRK